MPETEEIQLPRTLPAVGKTAVWSLLFFALINLCVWWRYDAQAILVSPVRLADHHSENELRRVSEAVVADDNSHLVLIGNSIIWGVGLPDATTRLDAVLSDSLKDSGTPVINLALPGNSLLDYYAQLDQLYNPRDTFVVFVSPVHFEAEHANVTFDELVRYPGLVKQIFADQQDILYDCCHVLLPPSAPAWHSVADSLLWNAVPLYRNRDVITKNIIGFPAHVAVHTVLRRSFSKVMRLVGAEDNLLPRIVKGVGFQPEEDFTDSTMLLLLDRLSLPYADEDNVMYVLLDNNRYPEGDVRNNNYALIQGAIHSNRILNLHHRFPKDVYLEGDTLHMNTDGHALLAKEVLDFLSQNDAP